MIMVRSQNKEILTEAVSFKICELCENGKVNQYSIDGELANGNTYELGVYSTKEKALKVLDGMQNRVLMEKYTEFRPKHFLYDIDVSGLVFQMPQDNEVEA